MRLSSSRPLLALALLLAASTCLAQTAPTRPRITGISHVAYYVSDMPKAMVFWHDLLSYQCWSPRLFSMRNVC
jgi:lactoylglutathione lyase